MSQAPKSTTYDEREKLISAHESSFSKKELSWAQYLKKDAPYWNVSPSTADWLGEWLSAGADIDDLPQTVVDELSHYRLTFPTKLYRAEVTHKVPSELQAYTTCSSWTYDLEIAKRFAEGTHDDGSPIIIVSTIAMSHESLVDTTRIPPRFNGHREEREVILLPGIFSLHSIE